MEEMDIPSVMELKRCGVRFMAAEGGGGGGVGAVRFEREKAVMWLPKVKVDGNSEVTMRNIVAYEATAKGDVEPAFARYTEMMKGMIDEAADIRVLREEGVVVNMMRTDGEAVEVWNGMGKCLRLGKVKVLDLVISQVNRFYRSRWRVRVRRFARRCAALSWEVSAFVLVLQLLLFLTLLQLVCVFRGCSRVLPTNGRSAERRHTCDIDHTTVVDTLALYSSDWKRASEFFDWIETTHGFKHTTSTFNQMIDISGKFFEFQISWNLIEKMAARTESSPDHVTFRILFKRYTSARLVNEAIHAYDRAARFGLKDEVSFSNLIDALCEHRHVFEAEDLCRSMKSKLGFQPSTKIYNMILRGWLKIGWWSKCRRFWEEMDGLGVSKDLHSYSIYMDFHSKRNKPWRTVKLHKEMLMRNIRLDTVAYNTVIHAVGVYEGVDVAMRLGNEMVERGCRPSVATFNTIIKLLCGDGRVEQAYEVLNRMKCWGCMPNAITFHSIFRHLNIPKQVLGLLDTMMDHGVDPRMDTYVMVMRKFRRWGFLRPIFIVWNKMKEAGYCPSEFAYNVLIDALIDKRMIDLARMYDEEMVAKGLSPKMRAELKFKCVK